MPQQHLAHIEQVDIDLKLKIVVVEFRHEFVVDEGLPQERDPY